MENNKLLIGIQFTDVDYNGKMCHTNIELYVLRDISLYQLLEGVQYGIRKLASEGGENAAVYSRCAEIYSNCVDQVASDSRGRQYFTHITFTSFNFSVAEKYVKFSDRTTFFTDDKYKPICDLGFINSSRLIFDITGAFVPKGMLNTSNVIEAFNPKTSEKIFFPEYNISSRQLYKFDTKPVKVISPTDPPKKPNQGLLSMLLPSIITIGVLILVRSAFMSSSGSSGFAMIALSAAMGIAAIVSTTMSWKRQKKEYAQNLADWRRQYQEYVTTLIKNIKERQNLQSMKLDELYPDMLSLIIFDNKGIYGLNDNLYSRSPNDEDFLTFRLGISNQVESLFEIKGDEKEVVFSPASFDILNDQAGNEKLKIYLRSELSKAPGNTSFNLCRLPSVLSQKYQYMKSAPLLYSLKDKKSLGIVDYNINNITSTSHFLISRMIFELCYYHPPEDLQFIIFFKEQSDWNKIENEINKYKFMPHFRGLFSDKSQFVFDSVSANLVLSSLLTIMGRRQSAGEEAMLSPHIVLVVYEDFGLKEHAFAEYLPEAPDENSEQSSNLGLTFIFATKYKEYLPSYCDDIINCNGSTLTLTPRYDINRAKDFYYNINRSENDTTFFADYTQTLTRALRFFSSVYYARIAQNGKVPSSVSAFELFGSGKEMERIVSSFWGADGGEHPSVTKSLNVPIGKTETGTAYLDLHEKGDGPHMLVAGTTGSGKTETIITYLLALCIKYRPDELNLLLVDMKGGGFTKRIGHLPHVVGAVTDVDGDENGTGSEYMLSRFLFAMKSEIKRRKILFNKLYVDSIDAYISACNDIEAHIQKKNVSGEEADELRRIAKEDKLSHLILIVDEFTELKRFTNENNDVDFMGEITTIARVGRSLGFHIILISQNIEGAITEDIRVNSRARLCLKVATKQASKDMIGTELAASPYMPGNGRAYLLVGTGSKFEYFQSGYSGAGEEEEVPVNITLASKYGAYTEFYNSEKDNTKLRSFRESQKKQGIAKTQLEAIADAICSVYSKEKSKINTPHMIFRSPLPSRIVLGKDNTVIDLGKEKQSDR